ncbi:MAG: lipoxygenase family protein [Pseudomonadota bacterium]
MSEAIRDFFVLKWERFHRSWTFMVLMRPVLILLITLNSIFTRERMSHENGLVVRGHVKIRDDLDIPETKFFEPGKEFPCRMRHASVSFMDDAALVVRAASIKFADENVSSPFDMLMNNGNTTPFWNMDTFWQFMRARMKGGRAHLVEYFKRNPRCYFNVRDAVRRNPSSFANLHYYSQIPIRYHAKDGVERYAKFRLLPETGEVEDDGIPEEDDLDTPWFQEALSHEDKTRNYLKDEYRARLSESDVKYRLQIQILDWRPSDDRNYELNSLYPWNEDECPWHDLADVTITSAMSYEDGNRCLFSLRHLPAGTLSVVPATGFEDGASIDYLRLGGWWPRRARLAVYKFFGQKPPIPDARDKTAADFADETTSTLVSQDVYMRPCLPQHDTEERGIMRARDLERARGLYQYLHGYIETEASHGSTLWEAKPWYQRVFKIYEKDPVDRPSVKMPLPPFIRTLPPEEQYSQYIQGRLYKIIGASVVSLVLSWIEKKLTDREGLSVYRHLFWGYRDKPLSMKNWRDDAEYGRQRLAGLNPLMLRRYEAFDPDFPVTDEHVDGLLDEGETLESAMAAGRLFWCNYAMLKGISVKPGRYLAHPKALYYARPDGSLKPIAIQLYQTPDGGPIFTPKDDAQLWLAVKAYTASADAQMHEVVEHLLHGHLIVEVFDVAMHRTLPDAHPINKLLMPHLEYTMAVNNSARTAMLAPGGPIDKTMAIGAKGAFELMGRAWWEQWDFEMHNIPADIKARGLDDCEVLPNFPWRDDALALWGVIERYVTNMVDYFYNSDQDVIDDWELQAFHHEVRSTEGGNVRGMPGGDDGFTSRAVLVEVLTRIIYAATAGHAAVNNGQYDYYGYIPNTPGALYREPPRKTTEDWTETDLARAMPPFKAASIQILMVRLLSRETEMPIGKFHWRFFAGTQGVLPIVTEFRRELFALAEQIEARNRALDVPYTYLDPKQVACSITA